MVTFQVKWKKHTLELEEEKEKERNLKTSLLPTGIDSGTTRSKRTELMRTRYPRLGHRDKKF